MSLLEFILLLVVAGPLLVIVYKMKDDGAGMMRTQIKAEMDRLRAVKGDYSKSDDDD